MALQISQIFAMSVISINFEGDDNLAPGVACRRQGRFLKRCVADALGIVPGAVSPAHGESQNPPGEGRILKSL